MNNEELHSKFDITSEQLDTWASEYENSDWSHMHFGEIIVGRPKISDEPLDSLTVKIPHSRAIAIKRIQQQTGMSKSDFVRRAIEHELLAMG